MAQKQQIDIDMDDRDSEIFMVVGQSTGPVDEDAPIGAGAIIEGDIVDEDIDPADKLPKQARKNADGSVTLPLFFPQKLMTKKNGAVRERTFNEFVMHRLNGADQRAIAGVSDDLTNVVAFARTTRLSQAVMNVLYDKLDAADITAMAQVLSHFLGSGPKTGK